MAKLLRDEIPGRGQGREIDTAFDPEPPQHIGDILAGDIARGTHGIGTSAKARDGGIDGRRQVVMTVIVPAINGRQVRESGL